MKILIATGIFPPEIGGPATYADLLSKELNKRSIETVILPFRSVHGYPRVIRHFAYFFKVLSASKGADIVFTQDPVSTGIPVVLASFFSKKKVILRVAGDYAWEQSCQRFGVKDSIDEFQKKHYSGRVQFFKKLQSFSVKRADIVYSPSKYFAELVAGWTNNSREVKAIYNGIDLNAPFEKLPKHSTKTIFSAGRLVQWKGFDTLITSLHQLPGWNLEIAGDGPDRVRLEKLVNDSGLQNHVKFLGMLPRPELFKAMHQAHVFALLSKFESFSFQVVEALSVGLPVIATNQGNLSEIITSGKNGVLIDPTNVNEFVQTVKKIEADSTYAHSLSMGAKERAKDFSIQKTTDAFVGLCESLLK